MLPEPLSNASEWIQVAISGEKCGKLWENALSNQGCQPSTMLTQINFDISQGVKDTLPKD